MAKSKAERKAEAEAALNRKKVREVFALATYFLRVRDVEAIQQQRSKAWGEQTGNLFFYNFDLWDAITDLESNTASQLQTLDILRYALLYVVVEGWAKPKYAADWLQDPTIDDLLNSPHVQTLKGFRHSLFHPTGPEDSRFLKFMQSRHDLHNWAGRLSHAFAEFFDEWNRKSPS